MTVFGTVVLCLVGVASFFLYRRIHAVGELFFGIGAFLVALYLVMDLTQGAALVRLVVGALAWCCIGFGIALTMTVDSGLLAEAWKSVPWRRAATQDRGLQRRAAAPTTTRRTAIIVGAVFIVFAVAHHLWLPAARLAYSAMFALIGAVMVVIALVRLR